MINNPIHILYIGPSHQSRGGISSVIFTYMSRLSNSNYLLTWLETQNDESTKTKIFSFIKSLLLAPMLILQNEIVHIHTSSNYSFYRKSTFIVLSKILKRKLILHIHSGGFAQFLIREYQNVYKKTIIRYLLKLPDRIICLSKIKAFEIENFVLSEKVCIIPNPAPPSPDYFKNDNIDEITIFFAGWVEKEKGVFDLILAFSEVQKIFNNCKLIIAGKGRIDDGKRLANRLNLTGKIIFTGWLQKKDMHKMLSTADMFCLPSYCEGVPMSILEAMAYGLPIITTPVGGIPDIIENEKTGLFFQPGNIKQLKEKLLTVMENPSWAQQLGSNAKSFVEKNHSIPVIKTKLQKLYDELLD